MTEAEARTIDEERSIYVDARTLCEKFAALEQQVRDLQAQIASHEAAPYPHLRYNVQALGEIVLCGLDTPDYDVTAQTDAPSGAIGG